METSVYSLVVWTSRLSLRLQTLHTLNHRLFDKHVFLMKFYLAAAAEAWPEPSHATAGCRGGRRAPRTTPRLPFRSPTRPWTTHLLSSKSFGGLTPHLQLRSLCSTHDGSSSTWTSTHAPGDVWQGEGAAQIRNCAPRPDVWSFRRQECKCKNLCIFIFIQHHQHNSYHHLTSFSFSARTFANIW